MYIQRKIDDVLLTWQRSSSRKPLLIRGARQVGKSTAVRNLSKQFDYFIEINFDEQPEYQNLFANTSDIGDLIEQLAIITQTEIIEGRTLVFLDEIQASLPAISKLRYFYEKKPNLHVIAAGSLLEFALSELPSFGVGRVRSLFMYPFSFIEFLGALNEKPLASMIQQSNSQSPINPIFHEKLKIYFKKFLIIGGMPQAVQTYVAKGDLLEVQRILDDLIIAIQADFVKYKRQIPPTNIKSVFESIVKQVGTKFKYSNDLTSLTNPMIKQVIDLLEMAGLVYQVTHSSSNGIPLGAEANPKKIKLLIFDTGIYQRILGLDVASLLLKDDIEVINKGNIAELFVGLELLKSNDAYEKTALHYWHREAKNSQAEVDYVIQNQDFIFPVEVKAGTKGAMQSMHLFMDEKKSRYGLRLSLENFTEYEKVKVLPLYAVSNINTLGL
ncbi:ATP-binding protein [Flavobacterium sp.]|jgi:predicted AAA+ superfamily ATPase|uniref:ATP-binding protein n=1 Tax=Flavobacterium sp. TaxID=239 RepID=UPI0037BF0CF1